MRTLPDACWKASVARALTDKGTRVNGVAPDPVWTPLQPSSGGQSTSKLTHFGADFPMCRPGEPAELAAAYVLLASNEASFMSLEDCWAIRVASPSHSSTHSPTNSSDGCSSDVTRGRPGPGSIEARSQPDLRVERGLLSLDRSTPASSATTTSCRTHSPSSLRLP